MNKFIVNSKQLLSAITLVSKVVVKNAIVPILEGYLFQVTGTRLTISGSDLQNTLRAIIPIDKMKDMAEDFSFVVPPSIVKYLTKIDEQPLVFEYLYTFSQSVDRYGKTEDSHLCKLIVSDDSGRANYTCDYHKDFPMAPVCGVSLMETQTSFINDLKDLLNYVSTDELRPAMCGISFSKQGDRFELCATDGHRVKLVDVTDGTYRYSDGGQTDFILPAKPAKLLTGMKLKESLQVYAKIENDEIVNVQFSGTSDGICFELVVRAINERFPDYKNVIPQGDGTTRLVIANKKNFVKLIDKALLFTNKTTKQIRISLNGKNEISAEDLDFENEYQSVIPDSVYSGAEIEIGFNGEFLKEMVSSVSDTFTIEMWKPNKCGVIRDGRTTVVCMPVMLSQYV